MESKLNKLKIILNEVSDLVGAQAVLGWDQQTYMPPGGAEARGEELSTLARITHERFTGDELGSLLQDLLPQADTLDPESDDARLIKVTNREYGKQKKVPSDWVAEFTQMTTMAQEAWVTARTESKFSLFQPHLEKIVEMRRQYADFFKPYDHIYDPLLDDYEPGLKTADVQQIFSRLRTEQVALIKAIAASKPVDDSFLKVTLDEQKQDRKSVV